MKTHQPRKRFGQNFLHDPGIIDRIIGSIAAAPAQHLVEIGPGQGALTEGLLASGARLDAVELDRDLVPGLQARFGNNERFRLHEGDALKLDFGTLAGDTKLRVVGNLPYNISTPLIFHLLDYAECIEDMHFMLQREVVNRLAAEPGTKAWGKLGVMAQYHCHVEALFEVPPGAFTPPPRVVSAIVRLRPRQQVADPEREKALRRVVSAAFSQRRKTLRNTLRDLVDVQQLEQLGISPTARAETLTLEQFLAIADGVARDKE